MIADKTLIVEEHVTLPIDANGATIWPGARIRHDGKLWVVWALVLNEAGWLLDCQPMDGEPPAGRTLKPEDCVVVKPRTVEDVLLEFLGAMADATEGDVRDIEAAEDAAIRRYADKIRQILGVQP